MGWSIKILIDFYRLYNLCCPKSVSTAFNDNTCVGENANEIFVWFFFLVLICYVNELYSVLGLSLLFFMVELLVYK